MLVSASNYEITYKDILKSYLTRLKKKNKTLPFHLLFAFNTFAFAFNTFSLNFS